MAEFEVVRTRKRNELFQSQTPNLSIRVFLIQGTIKSQCFTFLSIDRFRGAVFHVSDRQICSFNRSISWRSVLRL
jgi:hypothetical protein